MKENIRFTEIDIFLYENLVGKYLIWKKTEFKLIKTYNNTRNDILIQIKKHWLKLEKSSYIQSNCSLFIILINNN